MVSILYCFMNKEVSILKRMKKIIPKLWFKISHFLVMNNYL